MKIKKIKPLLNHVVTTADVYSSTQLNNGLIEDNKSEGNIKEWQTVVAVGPNVMTVKVGDVVCINPKAYARPVHTQRQDSLNGLGSTDEVEMVVQFPIIDINDVPHLFIYDRDIDFIIEDMENDYND